MYPIRHKNIYALLCALLPLAIAIYLMPNNWLYPKIGTMDNWIYIGYAINFPEELGTYKISRLPFLIFNGLIFKIFDANVAPVYQAAILLIISGIIAFHAVLRFTDNLPLASLASTTVTLSPLFTQYGLDFLYHASMGWIFVAAAFCFLPLQNKSYSIKNIFYFFIFISLSLHTDPFTLMILPGLLIILLYPYIPDKIKDLFNKDSLKYLSKGIIKNLAIFIFAFSIVTAILCIVCKLVYGFYLFFMPEVQIILDHFISPKLNNMYFVKITLTELLSGRYFYFLPVVMALVFGFIALSVNKIKYKKYILVFFSAILTSICIYLFSYSIGNYALLYNYMTLPLQFLCLFFIFMCVQQLLTKISSSLFFSVIGIVLSGIILIMQHFYHIGFTFYLVAQVLIVLLLLFLLKISYRKGNIYIYTILMVTLFPFITHGNDHKVIYNHMVNHYKDFMSFKKNFLNEPINNKNIHSASFYGYDEPKKITDFYMAREAALMYPISFLWPKFSRSTEYVVLTALKKEGDHIFPVGNYIALFTGDKSMNKKAEEFVESAGHKIELLHEHESKNKENKHYMFIYKICF